MSIHALLSRALQYPDDEVVAERAAIAAEARGLPPSPAARLLGEFCDWWAAEPPEALRRHYVATLDLSRRASLDLTYYVHGDRRQRGLALVALRRRYAAAGLEPDGEELPDHLPLMLEFAALAPEPGTGLLSDFRPCLELLRLALERAGSPYALAAAAVCATLPPATEADMAQVRRMAAEGPPEESVGLEPFAPPEVMPVTARPPGRAPATCGSVR